MTNFTAHDLRTVNGFFDDAEVALLYRLACEVKPDGVIVEIGNYQGKSTICLGMGARQSGARLYSIDPHEFYRVDRETTYGMHDHAKLLQNILDYGLGDIVRLVALNAYGLQGLWTFNARPIDLIFIDADHTYDNVMIDFEAWSPLVTKGKICLHDYKNPLWPGVEKAVNEIVAAGEWELVERKDATAVLKRA